MTRVVWSDKNKANEYLKKLGKAVIKYVDGLSNLTKSYCYVPSERTKHELRGSQMGAALKAEKIEISEHYEETKENFTTGITFCSVCCSYQCPMNRNMILMIAETAGLLLGTVFTHYITNHVEQILLKTSDKLFIACDDFPEEEKVRLTMLDFFKKTELEYFIEKFTVDKWPNMNKRSRLSWSTNNEAFYNWPRLITQEMNFSRAVMRWDFEERVAFRQNGWNGTLERLMFEEINENVKRMPDNFEERLDAEEPDVSIFVVDSSERMNFQAENSLYCEAPFDDDEEEVKFGRHAERKYHCAIWRAEAKKYFTRRVNDADAYSRIFRGQGPKYVSELYWRTILRKIREIEAEIERNGRVHDFGIYTYSDTDGSDDDNVSGDATVREVPVVDEEGNLDEIDDVFNRAMNVEELNETVSNHEDPNVSNNTNVSSEGPGDEIILIPATNDSIITTDDEDDEAEDDYLTPSEDNYAVSENLQNVIGNRNDLPQIENLDDMQENVVSNACEVSNEGQDEVNNEAEVSVVAQPSNTPLIGQVNITRDMRSLSVHHLKRRDGFEEYWTWKRPCFNNAGVVVMGDSMLRCFYRKDKRLPGHVIHAFSGGELLEMIALLRTGSISKERNTTIQSVRERIMQGRDELPLIRYCRLCKTECLGKF